MCDTHHAAGRFGRFDFSLRIIVFFCRDHTHKRSRDCVGTLRLRGSWQSEAFFIYFLPSLLSPPLSLDFSRFERQAELSCLTGPVKFQEGSCTSVSAVDFFAACTSQFPSRISRRFFFLFSPLLVFPFQISVLQPPDIGTSLLCGWLLGPGQTC